MEQEKRSIIMQNPGFGCRPERLITSMVTDSLPPSATLTRDEHALMECRMQLPLEIPLAQSGRPVPSPLRRSAEALETAFLSEMFKAGGIGRPPESMNGGAGEEHFASFLAEAHARAMVARGGIGLADHIERALVARGAEGGA